MEALLFWLPTAPRLLDRQHTHTSVVLCMCPWVTFSPEAPEVMIRGIHCFHCLPMTGAEGDGAYNQCSDQLFSECTPLKILFVFKNNVYRVIGLTN